MPAPWGIQLTVSRLVETEYEYWPDGVLASRTEGATRTTYAYGAGVELLSEITGATTKDYVWIGGRLVGEKRVIGTEVARTWFLTDQVGSVIAALDWLGRVKYRNEYDAFGGSNAYGFETDTARFTGKQYDEGAGLYYFNARWYDQGTGRFTTEDPARDGDNWYAYCGNDPLLRTDPTGLEWKFVNGAWVPENGNDTIAKLAKMLGVDISQIVRKDGTKFDPNKIWAGQEFVVQGTTSIEYKGMTFVSSAELFMYISQCESGADGYVAFIDAVCGFFTWLFSGSPEVRTEPVSVINGRISSSFKEVRTNEKGKEDIHYGIDITGTMGEPIYNVLAGVVIDIDTGKQRFDPGFGNFVKVLTPDGKILIYAHLKDVLVKEGDTVVVGQQIGTMGNSGNTWGSTGVHLHLEIIMPDGHTRANPLDIITISPVGSAK